MSSVGYVEIANYALVLTGSDKIITLDDNKQQARSIKAIYEMVRDAEISSHNWRFAMARMQLVALAATPSFGFDYAYPLPSNFERAIWVGDYAPGATLSLLINTDETEWRIEGTNLLCNLASPVNFRYIRNDATDPTKFPASFVEAYATKLAMQLAEDLTMESGLFDRLNARYMRSIKDAIEAGAIEQAPTPIPDDTWVTARFV